MNQETSIVHLNYDCLSYLFSFIGDLRDLLRLKQVCKRFIVPVEMVCMSVKTIDYPYFFGQEPLETELTLAVPGQLSFVLEYFEISFNRPVARREALSFYNLFEAFPNLKAFLGSNLATVDLTNFSTKERVRMMVMKKLIFTENGRERDLDFALRYFPNVEHLCIDNGLNDDFSGINLPKLVSVRLNPYPYITMFMNNHMSHLERIILTGERMDNNGIDFRKARQLILLRCPFPLDTEIMSSLARYCPIESIIYNETDEIKELEYLRCFVGTGLKTMVSSTENNGLSLVACATAVNIVKSYRFNSLQQFKDMKFNACNCIEIWNCITYNINEIKHFIKWNPQLCRIGVDGIEVRDLLEAIIECELEVEEVSCGEKLILDEAVVNLLKSPRLSKLKKLNNSVFKENECIHLIGDFPDEETMRYFLTLNPLIESVSDIDLVDFPSLLQILHECNIRPIYAYTDDEIIITKQVTDLLKLDSFKRLEELNGCSFDCGECTHLSDFDTTLDDFDYFLERNKKLRVIDGIDVEEDKFKSLIKLIIKHNIKIEKISSYNMTFIPSQRLNHLID